VAGEGGAIDALFQRADIRRQRLRQHWYDAVGEIHAVPASPRLAVELRSGANIEAHIRDGDDRVPAVVGRLGPDRVVMVARIDRVDRDDGEVAQILALAELQLRDLLGLRQHVLLEHVRDAVAVDRDQREAARLERVAEPFHHAGGEAGRPAGLFRQHQIAHLCLAVVGDREVSALALLDALQEPAVAFLVEHAEHQLFAARELLHRMGDPAFARFLRAGEDAVAGSERRLLLALADAQARRGRIGFPALRHRPGLAVLIDVHDAQHGDLGDPAHLVEGAARGAVDQPFIGHVLQQRLQRDLVRPVQPEGARDLTLARRRVGIGDEIEDLRAGRKAGGSFRLGHRR
jgi:hypothetical protein